jgi:hypothetical protein
MNTGNLQASAGSLQEALDELLAAWDTTRQYWQDQQARQFDETYLQRIREEVAAAFPAIGQISQTFGAAGRDVSE